ncbi:hypothetical protein LTR28_004406 [Elasticomyces elasticus]|nr:hypothetical protein LTR28_004406 [Elasticomyces elasticus]
MFRTTSIQYNCGHYEVKEGALRNCAHDGESRSPPATSAYIKFDWACLSCTESMSPEELMKRDKQDRTDEQEALIPVPVPVHVLVGEVQPTTELPAAKEIDNTDAAERRAQEIIMAHDDKQAHDVGSTSTEPSSLADNHERPPSPKPPPPGWLLTWLEKASHEELQMRESVLESNEGYSEANPPSTWVEAGWVVLIADELAGLTGVAEVAEGANEVAAFAGVVVDVLRRGRDADDGGDGRGDAASEA